MRPEKPLKATDVSKHIQEVKNRKKKPNPALSGHVPPSPEDYKKMGKSNGDP